MHDPSFPNPASPKPGQTPRPDLPPLLGMLERADRTAISGWAATGGDPAPVALEVLINGEPAGRFTAGALREDLRGAGIGTGHHAFSLALPSGLSRPAGCSVALRRAADGAPLPGSPCRIPPEASAGAEAGLQKLGEAIEAAAAAAGADGIEALIGLLAREAARLLFRDAALPEPRAALLARWSQTPLAAPPDPRPRALFIDERPPDGRRDAGSQAALSHMRALGRLGWRVDFIAAEPGAPGDAEALRSLGVTGWEPPWISSVEEALARLGPGLRLVYAHRFGVMQRYAALIRRWCPQARLVYCVADLHHLRLARQLAVAQGLPLGADPAPEAAALRVAELLAVFAADAVITHSSHERALLAADAPEAAVFLVPWEVAVQPTAIPFAARAGVGFIGSYGHAPNRDAAHVLIEQVMPLVWARAPDLPCLLAGTDLPAGLRRAADQAGGPVGLLGRIDRSAELWGRVRLACAPLRFGAGLKGKVLDALAAGIPCICLPMAAEGMDLPAALSPLLAADPAAAAAAILRLHDDAPACASLAAAGCEFVAMACAPARVDAALAAALDAPARRH